MNKVYIASPFFNKSQLNTVKEIEKALDFAGIDYFSPRSEGILLDMTDEEREKAFKGIYNSNVKNMNECNIMVANIDDRDLGTAYEIGWFSSSDFFSNYVDGKEKPIFSYSGNDYQINVMLKCSVLSHNTKIENLITNILEYKENKSITIFDELTKNVT